MLNGNNAVKDISKCIVYCRYQNALDLPKYLKFFELQFSYKILKQPFKCFNKF